MSSRKLFLPSSAVLGLAFAVFTIAKGSRPPLVAQPIAEPARTPFVQFIYFNCGKPQFAARIFPWTRAPDG